MTLVIKFDMPKVMNFKVILEQDGEGYFIASAPAIPGCHTQGETYEEALENIKEAIELCLDVAKENKSYKNKIDFTESENPTKFVGITQIDIAI
jgi:predicted RNase H-like HicB family nuclease